MLHIITYIFRYEFMNHDVLTRNVVKSYMKSGGTRVPDHCQCRDSEEWRSKMRPYLSLSHRDWFPFGITQGYNATKILPVASDLSLPSGPRPELGPEWTSVMV